MFFLAYEVVLKPSNPEFRSVAGGYFVFWVNEATVEQAERVARATLEADEYEVVSREECHEVTREEFATNAKRLALFDEAAIHGLAMAYHRWPV